MFQVYNTSGELLITPNRSNLVVTEHGTISTNMVPVYVGRQPRGLLLLRPPIGGVCYMSGYSWYSPTPADWDTHILAGGTPGTEYCVLRPLSVGGAILRSENYGLETFSEDGVSEFTSRAYIPRCTASFSKPPSGNTGNGWNMVMPCSPGQWVHFYMECLSGKGIGETTESSGMAYVRRRQNDFFFAFEVSGAGWNWSTETNGLNVPYWFKDFDTTTSARVDFSLYTIAGL